MGDAEDSLPPSRKRVAGRELTRDNAGLDDEEECPEKDTGTFKKASDEVLATRRFVKVKKHQPAPVVSSSPSVNPFANIRLLAPVQSGSAETISNKAVETEESMCTELPEKERAEESGSKELTEKKNDSPVDEHCKESMHGLTQEGRRLAEDTKECSEKVEDIKKDSYEVIDRREDNSEKPESEEKNAKINAPLCSFQQLSGSQNAFTGLAGTGFSASSFSFGSLSNNNSIFGGEQVSFGLKNETSCFSENPKIESVRSSPLQEIQVETGEENESAIFTADASLFEFLDGGWKERGKGEIRVNISIEDPEKARLVMRARGNYRLILNSSLFPDMTLKDMDKKGVTFACINVAGERKEDLSTLAVKFKDASTVELFKKAVLAHKGKSSASLKTPENSPKARSSRRD